MNDKYLENGITFLFRNHNEQEMVGPLLDHQDQFHSSQRYSYPVHSILDTFSGLQQIKRNDVIIPGM